MRQDEIISMQYNEIDMMSGYEKKENGELTLTQHNTYNSIGQRIRKDEERTEEKPALDEAAEGEKEIVKETTRYIYDGDSLLATADKNGNEKSFNLLTPSGNLISAVKPAEEGKESIFLYNSDEQGSTSSIIDESGRTAAVYEYDEYGNTETIEGDDFDNEICYTGQILDKNTGLYYYNARFYDSESGTFTSQDTYRGQMSNPLTQNLYTYCAGDPVNRIDPTGHSWLSKLWNKTKKKAKRAAGKVKKAAQAVKNAAHRAVRKAKNAVKKKAKQTRKAVKKAAQAVKRKARQAAKRAAAKARAAAKRAKNAARKARQAAKREAAKARAAAKKAAAKARAAASRAKTAINEAAESTKNSARSKWEKVTGTFKSSNTLASSMGDIRSTTLSRASNAAGWAAGAVDVGIGIGKNIYTGESSQKIIDDAVIDATFVTLGIGISTAAMMLTPAGWGIAAAVTIGTVVGIGFSVATEKYDLKGKYRALI